MSKKANEKNISIICREIQLRSGTIDDLNNMLSQLKLLFQEKLILNSTGVEVYIHGSSANHTLIAPLKNKKFDIDVVVEYSVRGNENIDPNLFLNNVYNILKQKYNECIKHNSTIHIDFEKYSLDIMPGIKISSLSIMVPNVNENCWIKRTPKLLLDWYNNEKNNTVRIVTDNDKIMKGKLNKIKFKEVQTKDYITLIRYGAIDSNVTKVIQLLKRARDVFFNNCEAKYIPKSIILYILVKKFYDSKNSVFLEFQYVVKKIKEFINEHEKFDIQILSKNVNITEKITDRFSNNIEYNKNLKKFINYLNSKIEKLDVDSDNSVLLYELFQINKEKKYI